MLASLFGSENVKKVLLFLFVNRKCYAAQLKRYLDTALTPLQKAFSRLEKSGIISSYFEGKTKLYHFNPTYPLLEELEALLKKSFMLIPVQEQKRFYLTRDSTQLKQSGQKILMMFWNKLATIEHLMVRANTHLGGKKEWTNEGKGSVFVTKDTCSSLIFKERGTWNTAKDKHIDFHNTFRWTLDRNAGVLSLEHLRLGLDEPVFLFHLAPIESTVLRSVESHTCGSDTYYGQLYYESHFLRLHWRVIGPTKNEDINYFYT